VCIQPNRAGSQHTSPAKNDPEETRKIAMKRAICAVTAIGVAWLLVSMAPDIRRYLKMVAM
jgi:hypothetical protein